MDGNKGDVKELIRLRQIRPSFARMISWEFSKTSEDEGLQRTKRKAKKNKSKLAHPVIAVTAEDTDSEEVVEDEGSINGDSSEESQYDTAPEDDITELSERFGDSVSTTDTLRTAISGSTELDYDDDHSNSSETEGDAKFDKDVCVNSCETRRHRRSKKQKRKRAELNRLTFANELLNLINVFDVDDEVDTVFEETKETPGFLEVMKRVPSLVELCMKASRRPFRSSSSNKSSSASQILPYGIKRLLTSLSHDQRMLSKQLSYLQNRILPKLSDKKDIDEIVKYPTKDNVRRLKFPLRSVWAFLPYPVRKSELSSIPPELIQSTKTLAFLYTPTVNKYDDILAQLQNLYSVNEFYCTTISRSPSALSAFAVTIDLMLPSSVSEKGQRNKEPTDADALTKTFHTILVRVKMALRERYPILVNELFDIVIPYVMWSRGNVSLAVEMFQHLIQKETKSRKKAMYICESARMLQQFGDEEGACRFYRMATEMATIGTSITDKESEEVSEQCQILLANVYDTGVLNSQKEQKSSYYWSCAMGMPNKKEVTVIAGIESLMCFHGAHCDDWLYASMSRIEQHVRNVPRLLLHQSMVFALKGSESDSRRCFREFSMRDISQIGHNVLSFLGHREKNPWKPLVDMIKSQKSFHVKPLKVVWRTALLPPSLTNQKPVETHFNSEDLNLRITDTGYLTGDMQMLLPPQRDITLDPYTGSLVINNSPSFIGEWHTAFLDSSKYYSDVMMLPTPLLISSHEDGTSLHLLFCGEHFLKGLQSGPEVASMLLYWTGPTGQVAKLNLAILLKNYIRKQVEQEIKDKESLLRNNRGIMDIYHLTLKLLDDCYKHNKQMDFNLLVKTAERIGYEERRAKKKSDCQVKVKSKNKKLSNHNYNFNLKLPKHPITFGKTAVLPVTILTGSNKNVLLFVRTTSKAQFQEINIINVGSCPEYLERCYYKDEEFLCCYFNPMIRLYNEFGNVVEEFSVSSLASEEHSAAECDPCVIGPYIYGLNKDRSSVWKHLIAAEETERDLEEEVTWSIVPYWELLGKSGVTNDIKHLFKVGRSIAGKLLLLQLSVGLGFMNPVTMEFVIIETLEGSAGEALTEDRKILIGQFDHLKLLTEKLFDGDGCPVCRSVLAINNCVMVIEVGRKSNRDVPTITLVYKISLPGIANEACMVGRETGLLISLTMNLTPEDQTNIHEHVFYLNNEGQLEGVLPFLAKGPRSFKCVYLHGNKVQNAEGHNTSLAGWYVYMRDGKGGILGIRLIHFN